MKMMTRWRDRGRGYTEDGGFGIEVRGREKWEKGKMMTKQIKGR